MAAYATFFDNLFATLRMARPDYKAQAGYSLLAVRQAHLGPAFDALLADLATAIDDFDENLTDRETSTAGATDTYKKARKAWLAFVDDTMKDYVTPKLRKLSIYADFKKFGKSKLAELKQNRLLIDSQALVKLYADHLDLLQFPGLATDAAKLLEAVANADETKGENQAGTKETILDLAADRAAIARAQRRLKAQLELTFDEPDKVYSFFDFSKAEATHKIHKRAKAKQQATATGSATAEDAA